MMPVASAKSSSLGDHEIVEVAILGRLFTRPEQEQSKIPNES